MLSFMVLLVLILILAQIKYSTDTTSRVARNEETLVAMDSAIESALLQVFEDLKTDAESDSAGGAGAEGLGGLGEGSGAGGDAAADAAPGGGGPTDSKEDEWSRPQRTELNEIQLRILVQDEDSKFNLLSVLTPDEDEADKALDRLARVIEWSRKGTQAEIDGSSARRMADAMANHMRRRRDQLLPKPELLSDTEDDDVVGVPLSLRELVALDPDLFTPDLFRDYIDENGDIVHSLGSFLTVWSSIGTLDDANAAAQEAAGAPDEPGEDRETPDDEERDPQDPTNPENAGESGEGGGGGGGAEGEPPPGWAINVNTAPGAVLHALLDSRDLPSRFWDEVVLYRNEKDETVEENEDPPLDEYGREIIVKQFFHSIDDLAEIDGWENLEPIVQGELRNLLKVQSSVFSITVTARKPTGDEQIDPFARREDIEREEANWQGLVRTVRVVVWRRPLGEGEIEILPIVRWEVIDYVPFEVLDFPESRDFR
jgi:hypothetical protein